MSITGWVPFEAWESLNKKVRKLEERLEVLQDEYESTGIILRSPALDALYGDKLNNEQ